MYYPEQRPISEMIRIRRRTMLPDYATGNVRAELGSIVDVREVVARGLVPARHIIIDAAHELNVNAQDVPELLRVQLRQPVRQKQLLAGRDPERGRRVFAPIEGMVVHVDKGRIIMQALPEIIDLQAGVRGQVVQVFEGRGIAVEATGAIVQGIWGNDRHVIASIRFEPPDGMESISEDDINTTYRGDIIITHTPLTATKIRVAQSQSIAGIIAPSMDANLEEQALNSPIAIMLTTGFGEHRILRGTLQILEAYEGYQALLDAAYPHRFDDRRAELMIHQRATEDIASGQSLPLRIGMTVRITRAPYIGRSGTVRELPDQRILLENGLRVPGAYVEIGVDEVVAVPLANLELAGT
ncbi:MAG: hypothetical protein ACFE0Q_13515 [Anaerolineae bacterium]